MNRRYLSWLGLMIVDGAAKGMIGPYKSKGEAVKACQDEIGDASEGQSVGATPRGALSAGVFPIELEEVLPAQPEQPEQAADKGEGSDDDDSSKGSGSSDDSGGDSGDQSSGGAGGDGK